MPKTKAKSADSAPRLGRRIDAALGKIPCDWIVKGVRFLDVFHAKWREGDVAFIDGYIVGIEPGLKGKREVDGKNKFLVPGFIDAHVHVESSLMTPGYFEQSVLPRGTTTAICDPHELTNVKGKKALSYFLKWAERLQLDLRVMLSSCVPSTDLETNGAGKVAASALLPFARHPKVLGLAEMMNIPGVLNKETDVLKKLTAFSGMKLDGHAPLVHGRELSAYAAAGISSCHESTELAEAQEKLTKGIAVWIREGSVAKDLAALVPLLNMATSSSVGFCTDDRNPLDIFREGHIDYLLRQAIRQGVPPEIVFRSASWTVARHYGLKEKGAVAPGYEGDLCLLGDMNEVAVEKVWRAGHLVGEKNSTSPAKNEFEKSVRVSIPEARELEGPGGLVHVIGVRPGKILTEHLVEDSTASGVARLTVLERHGKKRKPANAYVRGFGKKLTGAIGSSVGHDSHNLIVVGSDTNDMRVAIQALAKCGGGFVVVSGGKPIAILELPVGGLMSTGGPKEVSRALVSLHEASRAIGCELPEPFLQLAFLSLPVIPSLKLTDKGLVDVKQFRIIPVEAESSRAVGIA